MRIIRVFPRHTNATPDDALAFTTTPPKVIPEADEIHISVAFTYDMEKAERLAEAWAKTGIPVKMGGPATGEPGGGFTPGLYLRNGYVLTSRGCPNSCWFCAVPGREGGLRELPVTDGHLILDDNLLACSEPHIRKVFEMLKRQPERPAFTGGLEAKILKAWHVGVTAGSENTPYVLRIRYRRRLRAACPRRKTSPRRRHYQTIQHGEMLRPYRLPRR